MSDTTQRDALERWIASQLPACSHDELRVIAVRVERMSKARAQYGELDLASDTRDFVREMAEENIDRAFYRDCLYVARQDEDRERRTNGPVCDCWSVPDRHLEITGHLAECKAAHGAER